MSSFITPRADAAHLRLLYQVCSQSQRLEVAPVLHSRWTWPFAENLRHRDFQNMDSRWIVLAEVSCAHDRKGHRGKSLSRGFSDQQRSLIATDGRPGPVRSLRLLVSTGTCTILVARSVANGNKYPNRPPDRYCRRPSRRLLRVRFSHGNPPRLSSVSLGRPAFTCMRWYTTVADVTVLLMSHLLPGGCWCLRNLRRNLRPLGLKGPRVLPESPRYGLRGTQGC